MDSACLGPAAWGRNSVAWDLTMKSVFASSLAPASDTALAGRSSEVRCAAAGAR